MPAAVDEVLAMFEPWFDAALQGLDLPEALQQPVIYAALGPGKRLRPALVLLCCRAVGGSDRDALPAAGAIELVHNFSLVHDDLPALDDDNLRRGRPTVHRQFSEAMAILAGDAMMSIAFQLLAGGSNTRDGDSGSADLQRRLVAELAEATTTMIAGQVLDTAAPIAGSDLAPEDQLQQIHQQKTAALLRAACRMGALCGRARDQQLTTLSAFGEQIGLMYQIVDDLLDVTATTDQTGKATDKDIAAGKRTWPHVFGIDESRRQVSSLAEAARQSLRTLGPAAQPLIDLTQYLAHRNR